MKDIRHSTLCLRLASLAGLFLLCSLAPTASASTLAVTTVPFSFVAPATAYGTSANSSNVFGDKDIAALSYFVGTGAGAGQASYAGTLFFIYYPETTAPTIFVLVGMGLDATFVGSSIFIAGAQVTIWAAGANFNVLDKSATISTSGTKKIFPVTSLNTMQTTGSDCIDFDALDLFVVSAGGSLCLSQTVTWAVGPITGTLDARLGGSEVLKPFFIGPDAAANMLTFEDLAPGDWSFSLRDLQLTGSLSSTVDVTACAQVDVPFYDPFRFGCTAVSAYSTPLQTLPFDGETPAVQFLVTVGAPEPSTLALLGTGLGVLVLACRRKR